MNHSPEEFIGSIRTNGWCALPGIPFSQLPTYREQAASFLRERGIVAGDQLRRELHRQLRAVCPTCSRWITYSDIFTLAMAQDVDVHFTSYGPVRRMRDGRCPNAECAATEALLIWAGNPPTVEYVDSAFQYLLRDAVPEDALRRYYRPDVVAYLADIISLTFPQTAAVPPALSCGMKAAMIRWQ